MGESPKAYAINEFCRLFSIGRTKAYEEIKEGRLIAYKFGKRTLIRAEDAINWLNSLQTINSSSAGK